MSKVFSQPRRRGRCPIDAKADIAWLRREEIETCEERIKDKRWAAAKS